MATKKINPGALLVDGAAPLDGSGREYSALVAQYMATNDDRSILYFTRARIAAVVAMRGVTDTDGNRLKMADVAAEWDVAPSTFSNARRSFGTLQEMGFEVERAVVSLDTARAHDIVKDRMRKFQSEKVRVTLANGEVASGASVHAAIVKSVADAPVETDDARLAMLEEMVEGVSINAATADATDVEKFLDALARFQTASDALGESEETLSETQVEFLATALAAIATAHADRATVSTTA